MTVPASADREHRPPRMAPPRGAVGTPGRAVGPASLAALQAGVGNRRLGHALAVELAVQRQAYPYRVPSLPPEVRTAMRTAQFVGGVFYGAAKTLATNAAVGAGAAAATARMNPTKARIYAVMLAVGTAGLALAIRSRFATFREEHHREPTDDEADRLYFGAVGDVFAVAGIYEAVGGERIGGGAIGPSERGEIAGAAAMNLLTMTALAAAAWKAGTGGPSAGRTARPAGGGQAPGRPSARRSPDQRGAFPAITPGQLVDHPANPATGGDADQLTALAWTDDTAAIVTPPKATGPGPLLRWLQPLVTRPKAKPSGPPPGWLKLLTEKHLSPTSTLSQADVARGVQLGSLVRLPDGRNVPGGAVRLAAFDLNRRFGNQPVSPVEAAKALRLDDVPTMHLVLDHLVSVGQAIRVDGKYLVLPWSRSGTP